MAISAALLIGLLVRPGSLPRQQPLRWWDALWLTWILALPLSYLTNGYPAYNALSALFLRAMIYGVPYWVGRATFQSPASIRILLRCAVIASLTYIPLIIWEIRMSPQLHTQVYGAFQHVFSQTRRGGGFRPIVFTSHPLKLALWFATVLLIAAGFRKHLSGVPAWYARAWWLVPGLVLVLYLCKSLGPLALGLAAAISLTSRFCRPLMALAIFVGAAYILGRILFDEEVYRWVMPWLDYIPADRAQSIQFRMDNERLLLARAWQQPWLGLVNEGFRSVIIDGQAKKEIVTDSFWIIAFGTTGFLGLTSFYGTIFTAAIRGHLHNARHARAETQLLSVIVGVLVLDTVVNGRLTVFGIVSTGAVLGLSAKTRPGPLAGASGARTGNARTRLRPRQPPEAAS